MISRVPLLAALALCAASSGALAQSSAANAPRAAAPSDGQTLPNVSTTGQRMPDVGASKSSGVTPLDQKEERKMKKDTQICKGC